ncbi:hypothetical protein J542_0553 [Acinetobacter baumannii 299505]|uniref:hypothetical protein n=1 Tax=Acinetobacter baumannii TaxID=470 RepID=UPI00044C1C43|nr:hypothetical protein [Acinetobacter baumannii]EXB85491.1 hypothetical protein J542_0553 [Acinetobacter baumannii 299505]
MKPEQFIRDYGVIRAKELINDPLHPKMTHVSDDGRHWVNENNKNLDENIRKQLPGLMRLEDLKRLVESVELVEKFGSLIAAKAYVPDGYKSDRLKQAIRDHESIYGGGDE